jgi:ATP-dependent Clp protease ATP-binding subunit ClpC
MFEHFSDRARKIMGMTADVAKDFGHAKIWPEHILLALVREGGGFAAVALKEIGVSPAAMIAEIEKRVPRGEAREDVERQGVGFFGRLRVALDEGRATPGKLPQSRQARHVIELAIEETRRQGQQIVGTGHLLLGLLLLDDSLTAAILADLGIDTETARKKIEERTLEGHAL